MLDSKLQFLINYYAISKVSDWTAITPAQILAHDGIADKTLNYLRVLLASHGFTLKDDRTPEFWKKNLPEVRVVDSITDPEWGQDRGAICPFVIYVDPAEQLPFAFQGMRCDANEDHRPLVVHSERRALGRADSSLGDYSTDTGMGRCHIERKSIADLQSTLLGFRSTDGRLSRRERFERELQNLSEIQAGLVIIEGGFNDLLTDAPDTDFRQKQENAKILNRSVLSLMQSYRVQWHFAGTRRLAEIFAFRWLYRFHEKQVEAAKLESKRLKKLQAPVSECAVSGAAAGAAGAAQETVASLF